jgi:hypothetical protein
MQRTLPSLPRLLALGLALALLGGVASAAVLDLPITASSDDAEEASTGVVTLTSTDLELVLDASLQTVGLRFAGVAIPPGHLVTAAWVQFRTDETGSGAVSLTLRGEASPNAAAFTTAGGSVSARPRTAEAVAWSPPAWNTLDEAGPSQRTPDLSALIQAIVDGPGWASGNALALIVTGTGRRTADAFDGGSAPVLHVEFELPDDFPPQLSLDSPEPNAAFAAGEPVAFAASASDVEDGDLGGAVTWASDRAGPLGSGAFLVRTDLAPGLHQITASVTDAGGSTRVRSTELLITPLARLLAAGDIAGCSWTGDEQTASLLDGLPGLVLTLGDNVYPNGTAAEFASCYLPSWGRHEERTRPSPGNHDFITAGGSGYFGFFGARAGPAPQGWYSFDYAGWHLIALNSNCLAIGGCGRSSPQGVWLAADLDAHPSRCTLAYWHHARFSSNEHGNDPATHDLFAILHERAADVVLVGHDHGYERFAPQSPAGLADPSGIRQFVVGTGGAARTPMQTVEPNSEVRNTTSFGLLGLDLAPDGYTWQFHPVPPQTFADAGSAACVVRAPEVSITSPAPGSAFARGAPIAFAATATDAEEGDLSASLAWSSSLDGALGSGAGLTSSTLRCGSHVVTASLTDAHGESGAAELALAVTCPNPWACGLGPELLAVLAGLALARRRLRA